MNQEQIDQKRKRTELLVKGAALCAIAFVFAPFVATVVTGLVGLIVVGTISCTLIFFAPVAAQMAGNLRLKMIKAEAARNPMETLQNDLKDKTVVLDNRKNAIERLNGQIRTFSDKVDGLKERFGANDSGYIKLSRDLVDLRRVYTSSVSKWNEAHKQLGLYEDEIERAGMIWDAAQAAAAARETSGLTEDEFFAKLRTETAFDSIQNNYNTALAAIDTALDDGKSRPIIADSPAADALPQH